MLVKSLRFLGQVSGDTDVSMIVTMAGQSVFDGTIAAIDNNKSSVVLFQTQIPSVCSNIIPMTVMVSSGTVVMEQVLINQQLVFNKNYNSFQLAAFQNANKEEKLNLISKIANPPFTDQQLEFLRSPDPKDWDEQKQLIDRHQCSLEIADPNVWASIPIDDPRKNVMLNGILQQPQRRPDQNGTWHWTIESGNILSYDLVFAQFWRPDQNGTWHWTIE